MTDSEQFGFNPFNCWPAGPAKKFPRWIGNHHTHILYQAFHHDVFILTDQCSPHHQIKAAAIELIQHGHLQERARTPRQGTTIAFYELTDTGVSFWGEHYPHINRTDDWLAYYPQFATKDTP